MTTREIVQQYLETNGFEGLWNEDCWGCEKTNLMPCADDGTYGDSLAMVNIPICSPGYKITCDNAVGCLCPGWHIVPGKPKEAADNGEVK